MMPVLRAPGRRPHPSVFPLFYSLESRPSILKLISPDLANLVLLYPISLITQTLAFPHLLYANGLSLLW